MATRLIEQDDVLSLPHPGGTPGLLCGGRFPHSPQMRQDQPVAPTEPGQVAQVGGMAGGPTGQHDHRLGIGRADLVEPQLGPFSTSVQSHDATLCLFPKAPGRSHTSVFSEHPTQGGQPTVHVFLQGTRRPVLLPAQDGGQHPVHQRRHYESRLHLVVTPSRHDGLNHPF